MTVALLTGARNNCGDYLIVDRAQRLFARFLPSARRIAIDRTRTLSESDWRVMKEADLVVIVGGPFIRDNCAESLNLAEAALSGRLNEVDTPFVMMGGGAKLPVPFTSGRLKLSKASCILFDKLETSPYYSGTRDLDSLILLRNAGYRNFRFTGCPALYSLPQIGDAYPAFCDVGIKRIAFSCGAPGLMSEGSIKQHIGIVETLCQAFPHAEAVVAAHHTVNSRGFETSYGKDMPKGWSRLMEELQKKNLKVEDVSGGLEGMERLYNTVDLHVGYRVNAHVLMTSWRKPSVLIAEDGRASGMADVITGRVWPAFRILRRPASRLSRLLGARDQMERVYDEELSEKLGDWLVRMKGLNEPLNQPSYPQSFAMMESWISQFT